MAIVREYPEVAAETAAVLPQLPAADAGGGGGADEYTSRAPDAPERSVYPPRDAARPIGAAGYTFGMTAAAIEKASAGCVKVERGSLFCEPKPGNLPFPAWVSVNFCGAGACEFMVVRNRPEDVSARDWIQAYDDVAAMLVDKYGPPSEIEHRASDPACERGGAEMFLACLRRKALWHRQVYAWQQRPIARVYLGFAVGSSRDAFVVFYRDELGILTYLAREQKARDGL